MVVKTMLLSKVGLVVVAAVEQTHPRSRTLVQVQPIRVSQVLQESKTIVVAAAVVRLRQEAQRLAETDSLRLLLAHL